MTTQGSDNWAVIQMFEYLARPPDGNFGVAPEDFEPWLAESWTISDDAKTWVFTLRQGVQFHKGYGEMTSEDVARSFIRARDDSVGSANYANIADVIESGQIRGHDPRSRTRTRCSSARPSRARHVMVVSKKAEEELGEKLRDRGRSAPGPTRSTASTAKAACT